MGKFITRVTMLRHERPSRFIRQPEPQPAPVVRKPKAAKSEPTDG